MSAALNQLRHQLSVAAGNRRAGVGARAAALEALGITAATSAGAKATVLTTVPGAEASTAVPERPPVALDPIRATAAPVVTIAALDAADSRAAARSFANESLARESSASESLAAIPDVINPISRQREGLGRHQKYPAPAGWSFAGLAGRFVELSAGWNSAALTLAISLVWQAQQAGEPTAWIMGEAGGFYPPDAAANGVDLAALAVVRVPDNPVRVPGNDAARVPHSPPRVRASHSPAQVREDDNAAARVAGNDAAQVPGLWATSNNAAQAAGRLLRSGAFGLIVLDLGARARIAPALQGRLVQQAQRHGTAIVCLTEKPPRSASLGTLVALRGQARRQRRGEDSFACMLEILKDKRRGPGWTHVEVAHGPPGLR